MISSVPGIIVSVGREYFAPSNFFGHIKINLKMVSGKRCFDTFFKIFESPPHQTHIPSPKKVFCVLVLGFMSRPRAPFRLREHAIGFESKYKIRARDGRAKARYVRHCGRGREAGAAG